MRDESTDAELRALIAEVAFQKREAELRSHELEHARAELARVNGSVTWRAFQKARGKLYALIGGRDSPLGRLLGATLRRAGRSGRRVVAQRRWRELRVPSFPSVDVSIVIPVHSDAAVTERCLRAIVAAGDSTAYEVIVVDDRADAETKQLLATVEGVRVLVNERNLGYLDSTNRGADEAHGRHIVLLNNDTEPRPGWLDALVERAESAPDVGVVSAKLIYPDGALQEAGGIVWRDGTPWNFGNGHRADSPEYNYVREIDYGSAAALLVRSELWRAAGGFDRRYAPGYFEDTDLCFTARSLGWRVVYEPRAEVVHLEGASMGTDVEAGGKRNQVRNQPLFAEKWRDELRGQPGDPGPEQAYMASNFRRGPVVLVVDHRVPSPDRDSGSLRMWAILEALVDLGCRVVFLPDDHQVTEPYSGRLKGLGVEVLDGPIVVAEYLAALGKDVKLAILSRPYVAARYMHVVREHAPDARLAYDTVDLHFLRERRRMEQAGGGDSRIADGFQELELALGRASDVTLVVSREELEHLSAVAPELEIEVVPNANEVARDVPGLEGREGLLFVGGFEHPPNVDAALYLAQEIMPLVWQELPEVRLTIVGGQAPGEVDALAGPRVEVAGWVEDLQPLLTGSVAMVAPLRYGAGMKGKVTQSLAAGLPVVTTTIGAEGLGAVDGDGILFADESEAIAARVVRLHREADAWRAVSAAGLGIADRVCAPKVQRDAIERLLGGTAAPGPDLVRSRGG